MIKKKHFTCVLCIMMTIIVVLLSSCGEEEMNNEQFQASIDYSRKIFTETVKQYGYEGTNFEEELEYDGDKIIGWDISIRISVDVILQFYLGNTSYCIFYSSFFHKLTEAQKNINLDLVKKLVSCFSHTFKNINFDLLDEFLLKKKEEAQFGSTSGSGGGRFFLSMGIYLYIKLSKRNSKLL